MMSRRIHHAPSSSRKRNVLLVGLFCTGATLCQTATGFVTPSLSPPLTTSVSFAAPRHSHVPRRDATTLQAHNNYNNNKASKLSSNNNHNNKQYPPRLSHKEQTHLLQLAVEARRIRTLESQLAVASKQVPLRAALCQKAGYTTIDEMEQALDLGARARETLVTRNMGLVHFCLQDIGKDSYYHPNVFHNHRGSNSSGNNHSSNIISKEDLVQEGAIGLARAVDRWNPEIGGKFSTYALFWVRAMMLRYLAERHDVVRVPEHVSTAVRKVTRAAQRLGIMLDDKSNNNESLLFGGQDNAAALASVSSSSSSSTWKAAQAAKALAEEAGLTDKQVSEAIKIKQRRQMGVMSFESWMQQGKDLDSDTATLLDAQGGEARRPTSLEREDLTKTLSRFLRPREMEALSWRYGLIHEDQTTTISSPSSKGPRNYVAEAEEQLFGKDKNDSSKKKAPHIPVQGKWGEAMSFAEVGQRMHVSAEYGRRLCHTALNKLRRAAEEGALEPMFLY